MAKLADRVMETTINPSNTATITLAGAKTGYQAFTTAFANLDVVYYCIAAANNAQWEVGFGTFTTTGTTLTRTAANVLAGSAGAGVLTIFAAGTYEVFCAAPATSIKGGVKNYTANGAAPSINTDLYEVFKITGQTIAITGIVTTGTPTDPAYLLVEITSTNTAIAFAAANFEASGTIALPTTVTSGVMLAVGFAWNTATSKWRITGIS